MITSIVGILAVSPRSETEPGMRSINRGFFVSAVLSAVLVFILSGVVHEDAIGRPWPC